MSTVDIFDERICRLGEGPTYDAARNRVVWVDILNSRVLWRSLADGSSGECATPSHVSAAVPRTDGRFSVPLVDEIATLDLDTCEITPDMAWHDKHVNAGVPIRGNDAKADPLGRLLVGAMPYDPGTHRELTALYLRGGESMSVLIDGVTLSNGLGWSPDNTTMYYVDTMTKRIDAFDFSATGELSNRRAFTEVPQSQGSPDGLCVDAEGAVWLALWGGSGVQRILPDGTWAERIDVPALHTTSCAFVGPDLDLLVITSATDELEPHQLEGAGITYCTRPGVRGLPTNLVGANYGGQR